MVPAWAVAYLVLLLGVTVWSVVEDRRRGKGVALLALETTATLVLATMFVAYFHPPLSAALGRAGVPLFAVAFMNLALGAHRDIDRLRPDPSLSERQNLVAEHVGIAAGVLLVSPAVAFGALAALRAW